jgi:hypothetical protein
VTATERAELSPLPRVFVATAHVFANRVDMLLVIRAHRMRDERMTRDSRP